MSDHPFDVSAMRLIADLSDLRNKIFDARHNETYAVRLNSYQQARILERYLDLQIEKLKGLVHLNGLYGHGDNR